MQAELIEIIKAVNLRASRGCLEAALLYDRYTRGAWRGKGDIIRVNGEWRFLREGEVFVVAPLDGGVVVLHIENQLLKEEHIQKLKQENNK